MDKVSTDILNNTTEALNKRISSSKNYSVNEIETIAKMDHRLFGKGSVLDSETTELLRRLCASYAVNKNFTITKSHRPLFGPIIYFCKKLLTRILSPLLKTQLNQIENFNRMTVLSIAKLYKSNLEKNS